jgi:hypothetical protein
MKIVPRRRSALIGLGIGAALLALLACGGSGASRLEALKSDPMAEYSLPGAVDERVTESPGSTGPGVPSPATVRRTSTVPSGTVPEALDAIADAARGNGWTLRERVPNGYSGEKTVDGLQAQIMIAGIDADDVVWVELSTMS